MEFTRFCKRAGAQPYFAANLRGSDAAGIRSLGGVLQLAARHDHAGGDARGGRAARAAERALLGRGQRELGLRRIFIPEDYATEFLRYTAWVPGYGVPLRLWDRAQTATIWPGLAASSISSATGSPDMARVWGLGVHHYAWNLSRGKTNDWEQARAMRCGSTPIDWYELCRETDRMENIILDHWTAMGEFDLGHKVKLVVDEYGPWHAPGTENCAEELLGQQITVRDAVMSGLTLDTFNRHADKVGMAAFAQLVNCLNRCS